MVVLDRGLCMEPQAGLGWKPDLHGEDADEGPLGACSVAAQGDISAPRSSGAAWDLLHVDTSQGHSSHGNVPLTSIPILICGIQGFIYPPWSHPVSSQADRH